MTKKKGTDLGGKSTTTKIKRLPKISYYTII
jgi:hypothetical protein